MSAWWLIQRYAFFAAIAIAVNLAVQRVALSKVESENNLLFAMICGTAAGLVVKYLLDKRWIFYDVSSGLWTHGRKFLLYTALGMFTTCMFWGTEAAFWLIWRSEFMREAGAVVGLLLGYVLKYHLDRHLVFDRVGPAGTGAS